MSISISLADIATAKKMAKQSKAMLPHLTYNQRLNEAAKDFFKLRSYHELVQLRGATIMSHVKICDSIGSCAYCGFTFAPDLHEDVSLHQEHHDQYEAAVTALGYKPDLQREREQLKSDGYSAAYSGKTIEDRVEGALAAMKGQFDRSLEYAIHGEYWKEHPSFGSFVAMMSNHYYHFADDTKAELARRFGVIHGEIGEERAYWRPQR
ncbi:MULTISPECIES: hypothetical protein [Pseudomonas]|nr:MULTISPECIES: hypothetical protein [Pseudomonas]